MPRLLGAGHNKQQVVRGPEEINLQLEVCIRYVQWSLLVVVELLSMSSILSTAADNSSSNMRIRLLQTVSTTALLL